MTSAAPVESMQPSPAAPTTDPSRQMLLRDARVAAAALPEPVYADDAVATALRRTTERLAWADRGRGAFGNIVRPGTKVVVKPNFVLHRNQHAGSGTDPLVTHPSVIKAVVAEVLKAEPSSVAVADAPVQSCEFDVLLRETGLDDWAVDLCRRDPRFTGIHDYRRTVSRVVHGVRLANEDVRPPGDYVLYDLGRESLLEPVTDAGHPFRVTCYDPRLMARTHAPGHHQYLVARQIVDADVVINLAKLKTHRKAGITAALKNLVGINGNKEFLPHHRAGSASSGGDCYPERDAVKRAWELIADWQNMTGSPTAARMLATVNTQLERAMRLRGDRIGVEGAWSGNQTVARMALDLNRILLYGRTDATLSDTVQRHVIHVVDAVIAGQGEGPLAPEPLPLGLLLASNNALAMDWVASHLLGYDPLKIPLLQLAFDDFRWPIADFTPDLIALLHDAGDHFSTHDLRDVALRQAVRLPAGWQDARASDCDVPRRRSV